MTKTLLAVSLGLALSASSAAAGPIMYVHDSDGTLGTIDVATGAQTTIGQMSQTLTDIAFDPSGNLYGITFSNLYSVNSSTAALTLIGSLGFTSANALVFGSDGTLYTAGTTGVTNLFTVNTATGAATPVGDMGFSSGGDLAFNGGNLYLATNTNQLVQVNPTTGAGTLIGDFGVAGVFGLATGSDGVLYGVAGTSIYTINTATGAATNPVAFGPGEIGEAFGESFFEEAGATPTPVPEPGTMTLLGGGLAAMLRKRSVRQRLFRR